MGELREAVLSELRENTDEKYREFHNTLTTGIGKSIGVRIPVIKSIARKLAKNNGREWLHEIMGLSGEEKDALYQEELILWGLLIGLIKAERDERMTLLDAWVPRINSWAVCDCGNSALKFMEKDRGFWFGYVCQYLNSEREYELRFATVTLMQYFMTDEYIDRLLDIYGNIRQGDYYVNMAVAWAISVCFVKYREKTLSFLKDNALTPDVQNKAIQKIRESLRVSKEDKALVLCLKKSKSGI